MEVYADDEELLPGGIKLDSLPTWSWRKQLKVNRERYLRLSRGSSLMGVLGDFALEISRAMH